MVYNNSINCTNITIKMILTLLFISYCRTKSLFLNLKDEHSQRSIN